MRLATTLAIALALGCSDTVSPENFYGVWGAEGAQLTLTNTVAHFESPCWAGDLAIPIQVSGDEFFAVGTLNAQGGAGMPDSHIVNVTGEKSGNTLTLRIEPQSLGLGPYSMSLNYEALIPGCP
jgi:hypothetical protein